MCIRKCYAHFQEDWDCYGVRTQYVKMKVGAILHVCNKVRGHGNTWTIM